MPAMTRSAPISTPMLPGLPRWSRRAARRAALASRRADRQSDGALDAVSGTGGVPPSADFGVPPSGCGSAGGVDGDGEAGGVDGDEEAAAGWVYATGSSSSSGTTRAMITYASRAKPPVNGTRIAHTTRTTDGSASHSSARPPATPASMRSSRDRNSWRLIDNLLGDRG